MNHIRSLARMATAATLAVGLTASGPAFAESKTFAFPSTSKRVINAVKVTNGEHRMTLVIKVRPGVREVDSWSWYLDINRGDTAGEHSDFFVTWQPPYKPIIQAFGPLGTRDSGEIRNVRCEGVRKSFLDGGQGARLSVPQQCLAGWSKEPQNRVRVWTEAGWGYSADRAPGTQTTHRWTAWVSRG